jgi:predicted  nucleic acid-binding Zn-ribbon protein
MVEALLGLQEIDLEVHAISAELRHLAAEAEVRRSGLQELERQVAEAGAKLEAADDRLRKYQRSVQAGRATLKRLEAREQGVVNMQQHLAVRHETETARRNLRIAEDEAMDALQSVEQLRDAIQALESELEETRGQYEATGSEEDARRAELEDRLAIRNDQKENKKIRIDGRVLRLYEKVRAGRTDGALAALTPDGVCGHCYTSVPLQRQADIKAGRDLAVCEGCGVILYSALE